MPQEETQKIQETLVQVRIELGQLSTKMDAFKDMSKKLDEVENVAHKAMDSTKQAHYRLNKIDKVIGWIGTTVIGGVILAVIGFMINGGFKIK